MKKHTLLRFLQLFITLLLISSMGLVNASAVVAGDYPEEAPPSESNPGATVLPVSKSKLFLASASVRTYIYDEAKKKKLYIVDKGDSLVILQNAANPVGQWVGVMVNGQAWGYIKTTCLQKNKSKSIARTKVISTGLCYFVSSDKSYYIYSGNKKSKKIAILRKGIHLPILADDEYKEVYGYTAKVATASGVGYIYTENMMISDREDYYWDDMYDEND